MNMPVFQIDQATRIPILSQISLSVQKGEHLALIGPNGAGKSSLLRMLAGLDQPGSGSLSLNGINLSDLSRRDIAREIAYLSQTDEIDPAFIVEDYIALGRLPFRGDTNPYEDSLAIRNAAQHCEVVPFLQRRIEHLSGGERQRVMLARCLAQTPQVLLLDEPTNHLDLTARSRLLQLLRQLPLTIIAVLHDLSLVPEFATRALLLNEGKLVRDGSPTEVLSSQALAESFGLEAIQVCLPNGASTFVFRPLCS